MNKRHYEHTLPNIRGSLSNTYLQKNRRKLKLEEDDIECFRQHSQTQGRNTNYLVQSCPYNPVRARDLE